MEWARKLRVPLVGIAPVVWESTRHQRPKPANSGSLPESNAAVSGRWQVCAGVCAAGNVPWEIKLWWEPSANGLLQIAAAEDLFVFGRALPSLQKRQLLHDAVRPTAPATLVCAENSFRSARVLVLDNAKSLDESFLRMAAGMCLRMQLTPVVLSVAGCERNAKLRQERAVQVLKDCGVEADFDYLVGCEVRAAVAQVARWRRCQLVVGQHEASAPWWRWLRDTTVEELASLLESFSFLAVPNARRFANGCPQESPCVDPERGASACRRQAAAQERLAADSVGALP